MLVLILAAAVLLQRTDCCFCGKPEPAPAVAPDDAAAVVVPKALLQWHIMDAAWCRGNNNEEDNMFMIIEIEKTITNNDNIYLFLLSGEGRIEYNSVNERTKSRIL